jgi:hypothetical protein
MTSGDNEPTTSAHKAIKWSEFAISAGTLMVPRITRGHFSELSEVDHQHALA